MSLEAKLEELTGALIALNTTLSCLQMPAGSPLSYAVPAVEAVAEVSAPAPEKKTRSKKDQAAPVTVQPDPEPETTGLTGLSDDGFGDEGFGEEAPDAITIEYKKHDAVTALKALRDVAVASKGAAEGMLIARKALDDTGFGNVAHIDDADAERCVDIAVRAAKAAGIGKELAARALEMGVEL